MTQKHFNQNGTEQAYVAPSMDVLNIYSEGVLCESGLSIDDWIKDDEVLDFD